MEITHANLHMAVAFSNENPLICSFSLQPLIHRLALKLYHKNELSFFAEMTAGYGTEMSAVLAAELLIMQHKKIEKIYLYNLCTESITDALIPGIYASSIN